jgi:CRISPR-associated protein Csb1
MKSQLGRRLAETKPSDASALLEVSPTALLFGAWHSTGEGGGLGAKFARCLVSEIIGINVPTEFFDAGNTASALLARSGDTLRTVEPKTAGRRTGSRIDPLGILRKVEVFNGPEGWDTVRERAGRGAKPVRPSEISHGNIAPSVQPLGITCDYAEHVVVISLAGLRRLYFGSGERDHAGRAMLAALGLLSVVEQDARGYALRSRCDLVCDRRAPFELVHADGLVDQVEIDQSAARQLYLDSFTAGRAAGFALSTDPVRLLPQDKLIEIVRRSQRLALAGEGGELDETS